MIVKIINVVIGVIITVLSETIFFRIFKYKDKKFIKICVIINIITNLLLNVPILIFSLDVSSFYYLYLIIGEMIVVISEILTYLFLYKKDYVLIPLTISSNALSFLLGVLYYYLFNLFYINLL